MRKFAIATLISFGIFFALYAFAGALAKEISPAALKILFGIFYIVVFYKVHGYRRDSSYFPHEKKFSFTKEIGAVFREELVYYLFIFIPLAVAAEISCFLSWKNIVTTVLMFVFPFYGVINVPVLRSLVNIAWASAAALLCITAKSAKQHRKVSRASKYRR